MPANMTYTATPQVPRQWAWHYQKLTHVRDQLHGELSKDLLESAEPIEAHSMDQADSATDEFDHDMTHCILSHEQDALYEIDAAIRRIFEGGYGVCEESGEPIPAARLRAVPWTRYTRNVEERLEQEGLISRTRLKGVASIRKPGSGALLEMEEPEQEELMTSEEFRHQRQADIKAIESTEDPDAGIEPSDYKS